MKTAVTVWDITCDGCGRDFTAPRAQDYWSEHELADDFEWRLDVNDWTVSEDGTQHRCPGCPDNAACTPQQETL